MLGEFLAYALSVWLELSIHILVAELFHRLWMSSHQWWLYVGMAIESLGMLEWHAPMVSRSLSILQ